MESGMKIVGLLHTLVDWVFWCGGGLVILWIIYLAVRCWRLFWQDEDKGSSHRSK